MDNYRQKLKTARFIYSIALFALIAFSILFFLSELGIVNIAPTAGDSHWQSRWRGFVSGASCGIGSVILVGLIRISKALKDEAALKKLYVQANDERQQQIWTSARATAMQISTIGGFVGGIVAGYYNVTVSVTILVCTVLYSLVGVACKLYYSKKF